MNGTLADMLWLIGFLFFAVSLIAMNVADHRYTNLWRDRWELIALLFSIGSLTLWGIAIQLA
jgi:hypothetical protein